MKFEQRIMMKLQFAGQGQAATDMPHFITDDLKGQLVECIYEHKRATAEFIRVMMHGEETKETE